MSLPSARKDSPAASPGSQRFPQSRRLRKRIEFQRVYQEGERLTGPCFTAFFRSTGGERGRIGLAVPRALGKAVVRNRIKRRLREAIRRHWDEFPAGFEMVVHARRPIITVGWATLETEVRRVFREADKSAA